MSDRQSPTIWQVFLSVWAAFIGIQSDEKRRRDFQHGKPYQFIMVGLIGTALFVLLVWAIVQWVLRTVV